MEPVRSPRNQRVAAAVRLHRARERALSGKILLEGPNLLEAAADAGLTIGPVFALEDDAVTATLAGAAGFELVPVTQAVLDRLAPTTHPRGPVAVADVPLSTRISDQNLVVLWGVGDPGNAGTLIRTAAAFGCGVVFGPGTVDPWSPKVLRSAAGAHFRTPMELNLADVSDLTARGFRTVASVVQNGSPPTVLDGSTMTAVLVGQEANGLPAEISEACDLRVTIPMHAGIESLNASVAGSILLYEMVARLGFGTPSHD